MNICIYGASSTLIDSSFIEKTEELASLLAKEGHSLVFGCGANGLMGAAARSFSSQGAEIIGVVPKFFNVDGILFDKCTRVIRTETMNERKSIMEALADAFIITPGGVGTYEELFEALTLKQLSRHDKAIIIYNINGYYDTFLKLLDECVEKKFMNELTLRLIDVETTAEGVLNALKTYKPFTFELSDVKPVTK